MQSSKKCLWTAIMIMTVVTMPALAWQNNNNYVRPNGIYWANTHTVIRHSPVIPIQAQAWYINQQRWRHFHHRHDFRERDRLNQGRY